MKAIFPSKGVVIITKHNVDKIHNFYKDNLINSKLFRIYNQANYSIQVGNLNYLPKNYNIILENAHFLNLSQLHKILEEEIAQNSTRRK